MSSSSNSGDANRPLHWKIGATVIIIILAIPGLVIEPGPISEILAIVMLDAVWRDDPDLRG